MQLKRFSLSLSYGESVMRFIRRENIFAVALIGAITMLRPYRAFGAQQSAESPLDLVRRTAQHELAVGKADTKVMFTDRKETPHGTQTKLIVETREGMAGILVATNDSPLSAEQRQAEEAHLASLVSNPEELKKKQKTEKEDAEHVTRIMKALPDAFLYENDGTEIGNHEIGQTGMLLVRLKFRPDPQYNPPSHVEQVLIGLQGYLLIDPEQYRIAKIDGTLTKEVSFGWGFLGRLDKGGHFLVEQGEVINEDWELTRISLNFTGKVLFFKNLS